MRRSGDAAGDGVSAYSDRVYAQQEFFDSNADLIGFPKRALTHGREFNAAKFGKKVANFAERGIANPLYSAAYGAVRGVNRALGGLAGARNLSMGGAVAAGQLVAGAGNALRSYEAAGRALLTGHVGGPAIDGWMPGWRKFDWGDTRKYAANPRIIKRYVGAHVIGGVGSAVKELITPQAAPSSFYLAAGGDLRHVNDLGANARYGQSVMAGGSIFNGGGGNGFQMTPQMQMAMIDAIV